MSKEQVKEAEPQAALARLMFGLGALTGAAPQELANVLCDLVALSNKENSSAKEWEAWRKQVKELFPKKGKNK